MYSRPSMLAGGIVLAVLGLFFTLGGAAGGAACASTPTVGGVAPDCGAFSALVAFGILLLILGIVLAAVGVAGRTTQIQQVPDPSVPPPIIQPVLVQQTIEHDTVKVRCRYCGTLNDVTSAHCTACGASLN